MFFINGVTLLGIEICEFHITGRNPPDCGLQSELAGTVEPKCEVKLHRNIETTSNK